MLQSAESLVHLPQFEGPLELLLFLIKKEEINIADIPIALITERYLEALNFYESLNLDIGGEFLVMASTLMYIKSRMLLPLSPGEEDAEEDGPDPRGALVRQLLEFQMFQEACESLRARDLLDIDTFHQPQAPENADLLLVTEDDRPLAPIALYELISRLKKAVERSKEYVHHVNAEEVSLRKCAERIIERLHEKPYVYFSELVSDRWYLRELVVMFLAVLELSRLKHIEVHQTEALGPLRIAPREGGEAIEWSRLSWM